MESYEQKKNEQHRNKINLLLEELPDYCVGYINTLSDFQPRTRLAYLQDLKIFFIYLKQKNPSLEGVKIKSISLDFLGKLRREDIEEYKRWLESYVIVRDDGKAERITNGPSGQKRKLASLRVFYDYLVNTAEYLEKDPTQKVKLPKIKDKEEIRTLEPDELDLVLATFDKELEKAQELYATTPDDKRNQRISLGPSVVKRDMAIFFLFLGTGLRISELAGINTLDVKFDIGRINIVRKGGKHDYIYMPDDAWDKLVDYHDNYRDNFSSFSEEDALFLSTKHCRISTEQIERRMNKYITLALGENTGLTCHKFRATFATNYYRKYQDGFGTANVLGHSSVVTTQKYYAKPTKKAKERMRDIDVRSIEE